MNRVLRAAGAALACLALICGAARAQQATVIGPMSFTLGSTAIPLGTTASTVAGLALTGSTYNGMTVTPNSGTLAVGNAKVATISNTITITGTDGSTLAIGGGGTLGSAAYVATGTSGATVPLLSTANTWSLGQTFSVPVAAASGGTATSFYAGANVLDNGGMLVDQRLEGTSQTVVTGSPVFGPDRWRNIFVVSTSGAGNPAAQQQAVSSVPTGTAFVKSLLVTGNVTNATSTPSTYRYITQQMIEGPSVADFGFGTANALTVTVSGWLKTSLSGVSSFGVSLSNSASNRAYPHICTTSAASTWTFCSFTVPGDTSGAWLTAVNTIGMRFTINYASGSSFQGTADTWNAANVTTTSAQTQLLGTSSATVETTGWKVERGSAATPYVEDQAPVLFTKLKRCYQKTFVAGVVPAQNVGSFVDALSATNPIALGAPSVYWTFSPTMASMGNAVPTITTYNPAVANANWRDVTAGSDVTVLVDPITSKGPNGVLIATNGTVTTLSDNLAIHATAEGGC